MAERIDRLIMVVGRLEGSLLTGFDHIHRRMDASEQTAIEWRRHFIQMLRHVDSRKRNGGNGKKASIPYAKISTLIGLIILGAIGHAAPGALRSSIMTVLPEAIRVLIGG